MDCMRSFDNIQRLLLGSQKARVSDMTIFNAWAKGDMSTAKCLKLFRQCLRQKVMGLTDIVISPAVVFRTGQCISCHPIGQKPLHTGKNGIVRRYLRNRFLLKFNGFMQAGN